MVLVKDGVNTGDLVLNIFKFTFYQFDASSGLPLPVGLETGNIDPAELGKQ